MFIQARMRRSDVNSQSCFGNMLRVICLVISAHLCLSIAFQDVAWTQNLQHNSLPNIVLIVSDDAGFSDIGSFGGEIETPNLDRLAYEGVRFARFYTNARCSPTRASLLTGQYPHNVGVGDLARQDRRTDYPGYLGYLNEKNNITLAELLRDAGYKTVISGKWHLGGYHPTIARFSSPVERGFESFFGILGGQSKYFESKHLVINRQYYDASEKSDFYMTDALTDYVLEFLERSKAAETQQNQSPVFCLSALHGSA